MTKKPSERIEEIQRRMIEENQKKDGLGVHDHRMIYPGMFREEAILAFLDEEAEKKRAKALDDSAIMD